MKKISYKSYIPVLFIAFLFILPMNVEATEATINIKETFNVEINKSELRGEKTTDKGFIKKIIIKIKNKVKKVYRKIANKIKRKISKRKSKKDKMKSSFKNRNRNLYNIIIFGAIFCLLAALIITAYFIFQGTVLASIMLGLGIGLLIAAIVISLIYFSKRYILKPNY
ncbi:MAG: hypothetical protein L3J35_08960 [Bacteroidales bacterium]|nr:hypothetical protein [Bacteroidales bacterium]